MFLHGGRGSEGGVYGRYLVHWRYVCFPLTCFVNDDLMDVGCGRFFEGNAQEMHIALNETLAALPDDTKVYVCYLLACSVDQQAHPLSSPATNTQKGTSNSASPSRRPTQSRSSLRSRSRISRRRASL